MASMEMIEIKYMKAMNYLGSTNFSLSLSHTHKHKHTFFQNLYHLQTLDNVLKTNE